jgi:HD-GYP domain-containing protein (c-di-GMP phosphodiesterase class II)
MAWFELPTFEEDMLDDLLEEIKTLYEESEQILIQLELEPQNVELQRSLFRAIHTIKGDLGLVSFNPIIPLTSCVEDLLDLLRNGKIHYNSTMSDLVLLTMDKVESFVEEVINTGKTEFNQQQFEQITSTVKRVNADNVSEHDQILSEAVLLLDPSLKVDVKAKTDEPPSIIKELSDDLLFFRELMIPVERRSRYWQNRGDRIAKLCLYINELAGNPVDREQLLAAAYVHDFGMAFISLDILHKNDELTDTEKNIINDHVLGSSQLLQSMPRWQGALEIVMQHHERLDGSGYPLGLTEEEICEGAKILAIVDSFDALTHERAFTSHTKRPIKRAVIELNAERETLFSAKWLDHFNQAMLKIINKNNAS